MDYLPITLGIAGQTSDAHPLRDQQGNFTDPLTPEIREKILERDDNVCHFCGFQSKKYQDVHFLDGDFKNLRNDNLTTACIYCNQCFDLEKVAEMESGMLIWLPEIEQAKLSHIARAIYVARISQGGMAETANAALTALRERREEAKARISTDDPYILSMVMRDYLTKKHYFQRDKKLDGLRLLPLDRRTIKEGELKFNQFPQILAYWRSKSGPFGEKVPNQWKNFYAQIADVA